MAKASSNEVGVKLSPEKRERLRLLQESREELESLKWLYVQGPSGRGRVNLGITNSTGCSSVWGSTYPYNPYPFPWVNHLFQDAPSIAIGVFEGHMRKMGDNFLTLRKAEQLVGRHVRRRRPSGASPRRSTGSSSPTRSSTCARQS